MSACALWKVQRDLFGLSTLDGETLCLKPQFSSQVAYF